MDLREMKVALVVNDTSEMENLPKTMIDVLNGMLKDHQCLSWRVHGMPDKVVMNIIWSNPNFDNPDFPRKRFTLSSTTANVATSSSIEDPSITQEVVKPKTISPAPTTVRPSSATGKGRKLLPSIPDAETEAAMSAAVNNKQNSMMTGGSGYGPFLLEYSLMAEFNQLHKHKLPGVYVMPSALTPLVWNGVLFIRQGLYQEGVFKFTLTVPENYPDGDCPTVVFEHPVFHPVIDPKTGELDVKRGFLKWRRNINQLWQVLLYARRVFYKIDTKCPLNEEAASLYEHNIEEFKEKVVESIGQCKDLLYEATDNIDPHAIRFTSSDNSVQDEARADMLKLKKHNITLETEPHKKNGLTWIKPGTTQIFSREEDSGTV